MNKKYTIWFIVALIGCNPNLALAQNGAIEHFSQETDTTYIRWIYEYPSPEAEREKKGIFHRIGKFFFGKDVAVLSKPVSVLAADRDDLWVLDQGRGQIFEILKKEGVAPKFIERKFSNLFSLVGICSRDNGDMYITDSGLNKVLFISPENKEAVILNDSLLLEQPTGIAYSEVNNELWIVETHAHKISILDVNGKLKKTIGGRGTDPGKFNFPTFIWIDNAGTAYIVDSMNFRIQIFDKNGELISIFGKIGDATGYFTRPKGIATDSYGNIYVADAVFHTVQVFNTSGELLYYFGGQGREKGNFWMPTGIYIDDEDYIYVADSYNSRIQVFQLVRKN